MTVIWLGVLSHWLPDWNTRRSDIRVYPRGARHGLGLWNSVGWMMTAELAVFAARFGPYVYTARSLAWSGLSAFLGYLALRRGIRRRYGSCAERWAVSGNTRKNEVRRGCFSLRFAVSDASVALPDGRGAVRVCRGRNG